MEVYQKILISIVLLSFLISLPQNIFALELDYPTVKIGEKAYTINKEMGLTELVAYLYYFILGLGGIAAFAMIVFGGVRYFTSFSRPEVMSEAKKQITGAFLGLVILVTSFLILNTVNPQLVILKAIIPKPAEVVTMPHYEISEGVLAQTTVEETPYTPIYNSITDLDKFDLKNKIEKFIFKDSSETRYAIILFEKPYFKGSCRFLNNECGEKDISDFDFSSIKLIKQPAQSFYQEGEGINLFVYSYKIKPSFWQLFLFHKMILGNNFTCDLAVETTPLIGSPLIGYHWPKAFQIIGKGKYLAIFTQEPGFQGNCQAFDVDIDDLGRAHPEIDYYPEDLGYYPKSLILLQIKYVY